MTQRALKKKHLVHMHAIDNNGCFVQEIYARACESKAYKRDNAIERIIDAARVN